MSDKKLLSPEEERVIQQGLEEAARQKRLIESARTLLIRCSLYEQLIFILGQTYNFDGMAEISSIKDRSKNMKPPEDDTPKIIIPGA